MHARSSTYVDTQKPNSPRIQTYRNIYTSATIQTQTCTKVHNIVSIILTGIESTLRSIHIVIIM